MENAVQALKTAAAVLIFIIAITTTFVMFSKAKVTADAVITAQDKQKYLESPEVSGGILYTSSEDVSGEKITDKNGNATMTKEGYRIVGFNDVISTLYRYNIEKYGVTIIDTNGNIISRFDSNTESIIVPSWVTKSDGYKQSIIDQLATNTTVKLDINGDGSVEEISPRFSDDFEKFYQYIDSSGNPGIGADWYNEKEIIKHINKQINGDTYISNGHEYSYTAKLVDYINSSFIEILNSIDTSKYLKEGEVNTSLQTQYEMPTIEIIYILKE